MGENIEDPIPESKLLISSSGWLKRILKWVARFRLIIRMAGAFIFGATVMLWTSNHFGEIPLGEWGWRVGGVAVGITVAAVTWIFLQSARRDFLAQANTDVREALDELDSLFSELQRADREMHDHDIVDSQSISDPRTERVEELLQTIGKTLIPSKFGVEVNHAIAAARTLPAKLREACGETDKSRRDQQRLIEDEPERQILSSKYGGWAQGAIEAWEARMAGRVALYVGLSLIAMLGFIVAYGQFQKLAEQNRLLTTQNDLIRINQEFELTQSSADDRYSEIRDILLNLESPSEAQMYALTRIPDAWEMAVAVAAEPDADGKVERNWKYPNAERLKELLRSYMRFDRLGQAVEKGKRDGKWPKDAKADSPEMKQVMDTVADVSTEVMTTLHRLGPKENFEDDPDAQLSAAELKPRLTLWDLAFLNNPVSSKGVFQFGPDTSSDQAILKMEHIPTGYFVETHLEGVDLRGAHLEGVDFRGAHLEGADFSDTQMEGANLSGAHLEGADFSDARLEGANLSGAHLEGADFSDARLEGADLRGADFSGTILSNAHLEKAQLERTNLADADSLRGVHFSMGGDQLERINLQHFNFRGASLNGAHLEGSDLRGAHFAGAYLSGANLEGANLTGANFQLADLDGARLEGAFLQGACLEWADLQGAHLEGADLTGANMKGAKFVKAHMEGANLERGLLQGSSLEEAYLEGVNLTGCDLRGASFSGARIRASEKAVSIRTIQYYSDQGPKEKKIASVLPQTQGHSNPLITLASRSEPDVVGSAQYLVSFPAPIISDVTVGSYSWIRLESPPKNDNLLFTRNPSETPYKRTYDSDFRDQLSQIGVKGSPNFIERVSGIWHWKNASENLHHTRVHWPNDEDIRSFFEANIGERRVKLVERATSLIACKVSIQSALTPGHDLKVLTPTLSADFGESDASAFFDIESLALFQQLLLPEIDAGRAAVEFYREPDGWIRNQIQEYNLPLPNQPTSETIDAVNMLRDRLMAIEPATEAEMRIRAGWSLRDAIAGMGVKGKPRVTPADPE